MGRAMDINPRIRNAAIAGLVGLAALVLLKFVLGEMNYYIAALVGVLAGILAYFARIVSKAE